MKILFFGIFFFLLFLIAAKVFKKMGFQLTSNDIDYVVNCKPDSIERVLKIV